LILFICTGCSTGKIDSNTLPPLCLSGEGLLQIEVSGMNHFVKYESLSKKDSWLIGLNFPLVGEKVVKIGAKHDPASISNLLLFIQKGSNVDKISVVEIFNLLSQLQSIILSNNKTPALIEGELFQINISIPESQMVSKGKANSFLIDLMHKGVVFNSSVLKLVFEYNKCSAQV